MRRIRSANRRAKRAQGPRNITWEGLVRRFPARFSIGEMEAGGVRYRVLHEAEGYDIRTGESFDPGAQARWLSAVEEMIETWKAAGHELVSMSSANNLGWDSAGDKEIVDSEGQAYPVFNWTPIEGTSRDR